jgi:hypothetical protein
MAPPGALAALASTTEPNAATTLVAPMSATISDPRTKRRHRAPLVSDLLWTVAVPTALSAGPTLFLTCPWRRGTHEDCAGPGPRIDRAAADDQDVDGFIHRTEAHRGSAEWDRGLHILCGRHVLLLDVARARLDRRAVGLSSSAPCVWPPTSPSPTTSRASRGSGACSLVLDATNRQHPDYPQRRPVELLERRDRKQLAARVELVESGEPAMFVVMPRRRRLVRLAAGARVRSSESRMAFTAWEPSLGEHVAEDAEAVADDSVHTEVEHRVHRHFVVDGPDVDG